MKSRKDFLTAKDLTIQRLIGFALLALLAGSGVGSAQTWKPAPTFPGSGGASQPILLTDGTVMVQEAGPGGGSNDTPNWYLLVPDSKGSYSNGQWFTMNPMQSNYAPHFYASAVLTTGKVLIAGGEYNFGNDVELNFMEIFGPSGSSTFTPLPSGPGWSQIGDASSVVLPNGKLMLGNCCNNQQALLDPNKLTWTITGTGKLDNNSEEGWTLLPNGKVLTVDTQSLGADGNASAELYDYRTPTTKNQWTQTGNVPAHIPLTYPCWGPPPLVPEVGPAVLRPDGTVFAIGAGGGTAIYHYQTGKWTAGKTIPPNSAGLGQDGSCDGPAAVMPNGRVLFMTSNINPSNTPPADFYEFDGTNINSVRPPPNGPNDVSFYGRFLVLPTGNILFTDGSQDVEIFEPGDTTFSASWQPTITSFPSTVTPGQKFVIKGTKFTGLTQGAYYGDDAQSATNYPLVRLTINDGSFKGEVFYAPTSNLPSGVATPTSTKIEQCTFLVPSILQKNTTATLEVVANGIPSKPVTITIQ